MLSEHQSAISLIARPFRQTCESHSGVLKLDISRCRDSICFSPETFVNSFFFFWNIAQTEAFTQPVFFVRHVDSKRYYNKGNLKIVELFIIIPLVVFLYLQATRMFVIGSFSLQARSGLTLLLGVLVFHMFVHLYKAHSCQVGNLFFVVQFPNAVSQQEKKDIGKVFCSSISLSYLLSVRVSPSMYGHISYLTSIQTRTYHKLCGAGIYVLVFSCWAISYF